VTVIHGFIFIACVMVFRRGIVGVASRWLANRSPAPPQAAEAGDKRFEAKEQRLPAQA
jgi:hypothetical protein